MTYRNAFRSTSRPSARTQAGMRASLAILLATLCTTDAEAGTTSGSLALTSDDVFRGISQSDRKPQLQGNIEYAANNGLYAGLWGGNVNWLSDQSTSQAPVSNSLEIDVYGGYRHKFNDKIGVDAGVQFYGYPGSYPAGFVNPNTTELYAAANIGIATLKYSRSTSNLFGFADSRGSDYIEGALNWEFTPGWTFNAHAGKQAIRHHRDYGYSDWKLGVTRAWKSGYSIAVAYAGTDADKTLYTNAHGRDIAGDTALLTLSKSF